MPPPSQESAIRRDTPFTRADFKAPSLTQAILMACVSAGFFVLCLPGNPCGWLAWIALAPLFVQLRHARPLRGFLLGGLFGWLMWFTGVWWLHAPLHDMLGISLSGSVLFVGAGCVLLGLPYALAATVVCKWRRDRTVIGAARNAAICTVAVTWLTPIFHGSIAHTQYRYPLIIQVAELGGTPLLVFFMFWVNWLIADAFVDRRTKSFWKALITAFAVVACLIIYGAVRLQQFDRAMKSAPTEQWFTVGAIQPNIPINVSDDRQPTTDNRGNDFFSALEQAKHLVQKHPDVDLIALPENPATFLFNADTARRQALGNLINETHKPVMLNADAVDRSNESAGPAQRFNVAVLMDTNRNLVGNYAKIGRVPFVEYIPFESKLPLLRKWLPKSQRVLEGPGPTVFDVKPGIRVAPLICYEGTFSSLTRRFIRKGGNVIINQVNDSWFLRTPASEVHLALTLFRSVEYRVPLVRVTNSGIGAHIGADGRIADGSKTKLFTKTEKAFPLYVPPKRSLYAKVGDWWMVVFGLFLLRRKSAVRD